MPLLFEKRQKDFFEKPRSLPMKVSAFIQEVRIDGQGNVLRCHTHLDFLRWSWGSLRQDHRRADGDLPEQKSRSGGGATLTPEALNESAQKYNARVTTGTVIFVARFHGSSNEKNACRPVKLSRRFRWPGKSAAWGKCLLLRVSPGRSVTFFSWLFCRST